MDWFGIVLAVGYSSAIAISLYTLFCILRDERKK